MIPKNPTRYTKSIQHIIPVTDHRSHPSTNLGTAHTIGGGVVHHDLINIPFYGRVYDTATIAHPLTVSDRFQDSRTRPSHVRILLGLLIAIQEQSREDPRTNLTEWRARADSIAVLRAIEMNWRWRVEVSAADACYDEDDDMDEAAGDLEDLMHDDPPYGGHDPDVDQQEFFDAVEFSGQDSALDACGDETVDKGVTVF